MSEQKWNPDAARVGVIGLGYVGLPLARTFFDAGLRVTGFDVDPVKIRSLGAGKNYIGHLGDGYVAPMAASDRFEATDDFAQLSACDAVLLCVPTPLGKHLDPDLSYVEKTTAQVAATLRAGQLVVLESTTYPRTTRDVLLPMLEATGLRCGEEFFLAYSPEREDPGRSDITTAATPKLVGGIDDESGRRAAALYRAAFEDVVEVGSAEVAESAKLLENIYRAVNIALVNELKLVLTRMGIDIFEVIEAAKTKPFGFQAFYPGPGLGGHCIPIDPYYLTWKAREYGVATRFIELSGEVNRAMPEHVVSRLVGALNERGKAIRGAKVLVLGLAYKPDVDDVRESPSLELITLLNERGADVCYHDPHIPKTHAMRKYDLGMQSVALTEELLASRDAVLISTHHSAFDWAWIGKHAALIVDTRGVMRGVGGCRADVVLA